MALNFIRCCQAVTVLLIFENVFYLKNILLCVLFSFEIFILRYYSLFLSIHVIWFFWQDVTSSGCDMPGKWHIENEECVMLGMWDVGGVECSGCGMFGLWDVWDLGCRGCGIAGCGMFGMWYAWDVGCSGCGMWDMGCLPGCGILIYKMPKQRNSSLVYSILNLFWFLFEHLESWAILFFHYWSLDVI